MRESGLMAIFNGLTTIEEVVRETVLEYENEDCERSEEAMPTIKYEVMDTSP